VKQKHFLGIPSVCSQVDYIWYHEVEGLFTTNTWTYRYKFLFHCCWLHLLKNKILPWTLFGKNKLKIKCYHFFLQLANKHPTYKVHQLANFISYRKTSGYANVLYSVSQWVSLEKAILVGSPQVELSRGCPLGVVNQGYW